ncbi:hypothetical protein ACFSTC_38010 [Nonomuraea ferruginea]
MPVAHNLRFDLGFLEHEFARASAAIPALAALGVCTMTEAARFLPVAPRTLARLLRRRRHPARRPSRRAHRRPGRRRARRPGARRRRRARAYAVRRSRS